MEEYAGGEEEGTPKLHNVTIQEERPEIRTEIEQQQEESRKTK